MPQNYIENDFASFKIEDDILFFTYKQGIEIDKLAAKKIVKDRLSLQGDKSFKIVCDIRGLKNVNKEARDYFAKQGSAKTTTVAMVVGSPGRRLMTNFYLSVNKPTVVTKIFTTMEEAVTYIKSC